LIILKKNSNENLLNILTNLTSFCNKFPELQQRNINNSSNSVNTNSTNYTQSMTGNDDIIPQINQLSVNLIKFNNKIEDKFMYLVEEIAQLKAEKSLICSICKGKDRVTELCINCLKKFCNQCILKCKICEHNICEGCYLKFENCMKDCKNSICKNCMRIMNGNKKFKIIEDQFEKEKLCTKNKCYKYKSNSWNKFYMMAGIILIVVILVNIFKN